MLPEKLLIRRIGLIGPIGRIKSPKKKGDRMDVNAEVVRVMKEKTARGMKIGRNRRRDCYSLDTRPFPQPLCDCREQGKGALVLNFGAVQSTVFGEGLHFRIPLCADGCKDWTCGVHKSLGRSRVRIKGPSGYPLDYSCQLSYSP